MNMNRSNISPKFIVFFFAFNFFLISNAASQSPGEPSPPKTRLEAFEAQEGVVIIQGFSRIGSQGSVYGGSVSVQAKEFTNAASGNLESGIIIEVKEGGRVERQNRSFIDYEEIAPLLKGIEYISKIDKSVTKFDNFQVEYRTKGDLRVATFSSQGGEIMVNVSSGRIGSTSVFFKLVDLQTLKGHINSAKERLDAAKK